MEDVASVRGRCTSHAARAGTIPGMRWLEVRRHSLTKKGAARGRGSHLSAHGVALARAIGADLGSVAYVVTSASPRAVETAIAMGLAVDDTLDLVGFRNSVGYAEQRTLIERAGTDGGTPGGAGRCCFRSVSDGCC
jgi:hypothetical protein